MPTNKERIDANTARIEAIAERLAKSQLTDVSDTTATAGTVAKGEIFYDKNGVRTEGTLGEIKVTEIILPESFQSTNKIYTYNVDNVNILFGSSTVAGLWLYDTLSKTTTQLYSQNSGWGIFQQIDENTVLISTQSSSAGILLYDNSTKTCQKIINTGGFDYGFQIDENIWLFNGRNSSFAGIFLYDNSTKTCEKIYTDSSAMNLNIANINENKWMFYGSNFSGLLLYNHLTRTITKVNSTWKGSTIYFHQIGSNCLISNSSTSYLGLLLYDDDTETVTQIYNEGTYWRYAVSVSKYCFLSTSSSSYSGILRYNNETKSIEKIYNSGYSYMYVHIINDVVLFSSSTSSVLGIIMYDLSTDSISQIYDKGYNFNEHLQIDDETSLIYGTAYGSAGILLYDGINKTINALITSNYDWFFQQVDTNKWLISSTDVYTGIKLFDNTTKTITSLITRESSWQYYQQISENLWLIGSKIGNSGADAGILLYDNSNSSVSIAYYYGSRYDTFYQENGTWYIEHSEKNTNGRKLRFDSTTSKCILVSYYIEG